MDGLEPNQQRTVDATREQVHLRLVGQGAGHGMDHIGRVHSTACQLVATEGGDRFVVELAAWLHDVGDAKFNDGQELSGQFSREILGELGVASEVIDHVVLIVDKISFRKQTPIEQLTHEARIVQDADRLDALGAVGIVRTIEYGAVKDQPFFGEDLSRTGLGHFFDKLFKLRDLMNTEAARTEAARREEIMHAFLQHYCAECGLDLDAIRRQCLGE
ncbi:MAG: HD domain-containing protein [Aureliella sp.]